MIFIKAQPKYTKNYSKYTKRAKVHEIHNFYLLMLSSTRKITKLRQKLKNHVLLKPYNNVLCKLCVDPVTVERIFGVRGRAFHSLSALARNL